TVSSTSGRALDPFLKNTLSRSGIALGELCISWRQPDTAAAAKTTAAASRKPEAGSRKLRGDIAHPRRVHPLEELRRLVAIELRVHRFDQQEEAVAAGARERRHVERRVVRL